MPHSESTTPHNRFSASYFLDATNAANTNGLQNRSSSSASENTMETTVTMSPSEPPGPNSEVVTPASGKMVNTYVTNVKAPPQKVPLQPHQGRNPCIERNTMLESSDSDLIDGNTLLERGMKFSNNDRYSGFNPDDVFDSLNMTEENNALVMNDVLQSQSHHASSNIPLSRPYIPIPYLQNPVVTPKQPNVPGNGHSINNHLDINPPKNGSKKLNPFSVFDRLKTSNSSRGLKSFFTDRKKKDRIKECKPLMKERIVDSLATTRDPVATEVRMTPAAIRNNNNNIVVRPVDSTKTTEVGITKLCTNGDHNGQVPALKLRHSGSHTLPRRSDRLSDSSSVEDNNVSIESYRMAKRPTTLPLRGNRSKTSVPPSQPNDSGSDNVEKSKVAKRIKTPFKLRKSRFSLYDDSVMDVGTSLNNLDDNRRHDECINGSGGISTSVPLDINSLCSAEVKKLFESAGNNGRYGAAAPDQSQVSGVNNRAMTMSQQGFATISV